MPILRYVPLLIAALTCLSRFSPAAGASIADQICHNVTDYSFCIGMLNSEPILRPTTAINIAYIAFRKAGDKAGEVYNKVLAEIDKERGLENCLKCYTDAGSWVGLALEDINLDEYNNLAKWSEYANNNVTSCYNGYKGNRAITEGNVYMMKVLEICHVVSLQFI